MSSPKSDRKVLPDAHATIADDASSSRKSFRVMSAPNLWCLSALVVVVSVVALCWIFSSQLRANVPIIDGAVMMIITYLGVILSLIIFGGWVVFLSGLRSVYRIGFCVLCVFGIAAIAMIRPDLDANLVPRGVRFFWQPTRDARLGMPEIREGWQPSDNIFSNVNADMSLTLEERHQLSGVDPSKHFEQYRGPTRDGIIPDIRLQKNWTDQPPKQIWKQEIGAGWSGFVAANGYAVTMEQRGEMELVTCLDINTGEVVWYHENETRHETPLGKVGPRSTPTIHQGRVYAQGANGDVYCLDGNTGDVIWHRELFEILETSIEQQGGLVSWGRSGSPLVMQNVLVLPAGGVPEDDRQDGEGEIASLIGFDLASGEEKWRMGDDQISYSSPILVRIDGRMQIISLNESNVQGYDVETGESVWSLDRPGDSNAGANTTQPVVVNDGVFVLTKGYGLGAEAIAIVTGDDQYQIDSLWKNPRLLKTKFSNAVSRDGRVYGLSDGYLECIDGEKGEVFWKAGRDGHYGHGQLLIAGDVLLVLSEQGDLAMIEMDTDEFNELGRVSLLEGVTWNTLCLVGNRLLVRNGQEAGCWELPLMEPADESDESSNGTNE